MLYLITYDLNKPEQEYTALNEELKKSSAWWHYLDSTWIIKTSDEKNVLRERLWSKMGKSGNLLIIDITDNGNYTGYLKSKAWRWIKDNING